jgi:hypothetical protein
MSVPTASEGPAAGRPTPAFTTLARRITGGLGVAFSVVMVASLATGVGLPGSDATGATVELYAIDHYHRLQLSLALAVVAWFLWALFAGALASWLRRVDDATGDVWAPAFVIGSAGAAVLALAAVGVQGAYQGLSHSGALPAQVLELFRVSHSLAAVGGALLAAALVAIGISGVLNAGVPAGLGGLAFVVAVLAAVGAGGAATARTSLGTITIVATIALVVWAAAVSVWLLMRSEPAR